MMALKSVSVKKIAITITAAAALCALMPAVRAQAAPSDEIKAEIEAYKAELKETEERVSYLTDETERLRSEITETETLRDAYSEDMTGRVRYFYEETSGNAYLSWLFGGESLADALNRLEFQREISRYDAGRMSGYAESLSSLNTELESDADELAEKQARVTELNETISERQAAYERAKSRETGGGSIAHYEGMSLAAAQNDVAGKIYSALKGVGWNDEQIAGALGNIETECGFDFSAVETVYSEKFRWGQKKQRADDLDYLMADVNPSYRFKKVYRCGIGLIQWTDTTDGARGNTNLRAFAEKRGTDWCDIDTQLIYLLSYSGDKSRASAIRKAGNASSVTEGTRWWASNIEGGTRGMSGRITRAEKWYGKIESGEITYDEEYAGWILSEAGIEKSSP